MLERASMTSEKREIEKNDETLRKRDGKSDLQK
jgi:hypothetical protein